MTMSYKNYQNLDISHFYRNEYQQRKFNNDFHETLAGDNMYQNRFKQRYFQQERNGFHYPYSYEGYSGASYYQRDVYMPNPQQLETNIIQQCSSVLKEIPTQDEQYDNCSEEFKYFENNKRQMTTYPSFREHNNHSTYNFQRSLSRGKSINSGLNYNSKMECRIREILDKSEIIHISNQKECFQQKEQEKQTEPQCNLFNPIEFKQPSIQPHQTFTSNEVYQSRLILVNEEHIPDDNLVPIASQTTNLDEEISEMNLELESQSSHEDNNLQEIDLKQLMGEAVQDKFSKLKDEIRFLVGKLKVQDGNNSKGESKTTQNEKAFIQSDYLPEYYNQIQESKYQDKERGRSPKQQVKNEIIINQCGTTKQEQRNNNNNKNIILNTEIINPSKMKQLQFLEENLLD